jgi:hypothetical protein
MLKVCMQLYYYYFLTFLELVFKCKYNVNIDYKH